MKVLKNYAPYLTQGYKSSHTANDIVGRKGTSNVLDTIVAIADGTVEQVINNCNVNTNGQNGNKLDTSNGGNLVKIKHANGYVSRYLHGKYNSVKVKVGDKVKAGQTIMEMGNTGYSFGGHLHLDLWLNGKKIDPYDYVFKDKTFEVLPKPVERDETIEQVEVVEKQLNCRIDHKTSANSLGFCPTGIYNILYTYKDDKYTWYEIEKDKWVASEGTWVKVLKPVVIEPVIIPIEKIELGEIKDDNNTNTLPSVEINENKQENGLKKKDLLELIVLIFEWFKNLFK